MQGQTTLLANNQQIAGLSGSMVIPSTSANTNVSNANNSNVVLSGHSNSMGIYVSGSPPPIGGGRQTPPPVLQTPPSSASCQRERISEAFSSTPAHSAGSGSSESTSVELQVDYWPLVRPTDHHLIKDKLAPRSSDQGGKNSIKSTFRSLQVWRLPQNPIMGDLPNGLTVSFATKEKKQKQSKFFVH